MDKGQLLNDAERSVWDAFASGQMVDLGHGDPAAEQFDVASWGEDRTVRAEVIGGLLLGAADCERGRIAKVRLAGARIVGLLDVNGGTTSYELHLERCWLEQPPDLGDADTRGVAIVACWLPGVVAHGWRPDGPVVFDGTRFSGTVYLHGATIGGQLSMRSATLSNPDGYALRAFNLCVDGGMLCQGGFTATGTVDLAGARIGGQLSMRSATLSSPDGNALSAFHLTVDKSMFCDGGFTATGTVDLNGARIGGQLSMHSATLSNPDGYALLASSLTVDKGMFCHGGFTATGTVDLAGARIGAVFDMTDAALINPDGYALSASSLTVDRAMLIQGGFTATGTVDLAGAKVGGQLSMDGATLTKPDGYALRGFNLTVDGDMLCQGGFTATGTVDLAGARIGGQLSMDGATLTKPDGYALSASNLTVDRDMKCRDGFTATGTVDLSGATIARVDFRNAIFKMPEGAKPNGYTALNCDGLSSGRVKLPARLPGVTDLRQATIGLLHIPPSALTATVRLSGLTYTDLDPDPDPPVLERIAWLRGDPDGYHAQPYEQLAAYYRTNGHDREARITLLHKRRAHRTAVTRARTLPTPLRQTLTALRRAPGWGIDVLAGYGYAPLRAFLWLIGAVATGTWLLYPHVTTGPTHSHVTNAFLLALDSITPGSPFGIRDTANLTGSALIIAMVLQILGYALSIAVIPAVTRTLARADK